MFGAQDQTQTISLGLQRSNKLVYPNVFLALEKSASSTWWYRGANSLSLRRSNSPLLLSLVWLSRSARSSSSIAFCHLWWFQGSPDYFEFWRNGEALMSIGIFRIRLMNTAWDETSNHWMSIFRLVIGQRTTTEVPQDHLREQPLVKMRWPNSNMWKMKWCLQKKQPWEQRNDTITQTMTHILTCSVRKN